MNRRTLLLSTAVVAAGGAAFWLTGRTGSQVTPIGAVSAEEAKAVDTSGVPEMTVGNADAPVKIVEYASFTCPHCRDWHNQVWNQLKANYIDTGKVHFTLREVYFDRFGLWAATVARCGGGMRYFGIVDVLFEKQQDWIGDGKPETIADNLRKIGRTAGMNDETVNACMSDQETMKGLVALYQKNATADGVEGTPTFFVNGTKYSNMGYDEFAKIIDAELAKG